MKVDEMGAMPVAVPAGPGKGQDERRLDALIVEVDASKLPDQQLWRAVEDTLDQEIACAGGRHHDLGEVGAPPLWQRL